LELKRSTLPSNISAVQSFMVVPCWSFGWSLG
jgi:hypothetical protein